MLASSSSQSTVDRDSWQGGSGGVIWRRMRWWARRSRVGGGSGSGRGGDGEDNEEEDKERRRATAEGASRRRYRRHTANIYKLGGGFESGDEIMMKDRTEEEEDDDEQEEATMPVVVATTTTTTGGDPAPGADTPTPPPRQNGPVRANCTGNRCRDWNSANATEDYQLQYRRTPRPPSGYFYGDYPPPNPNEAHQHEKSSSSTPLGGGAANPVDAARFASSAEVRPTILDSAMDTGGHHRGGAGGGGPPFIPLSTNCDDDDDDDDLLDEQDDRIRTHPDVQQDDEENAAAAPQPEQWRAFAPASRACRPTFIFDPAGKFSYYWSLVVSLAFLYNLWVVAYRFSFDEITSTTRLRWFCLDYACDFIYLLDIAVQFRTGFLEDGVLQTNSGRMRMHYMNSTKFYMDCLSLLPLDFLYLSLGYRSILRCFRLTKVYKGYAFVEKTERHTNYPNVLRGVLLLHAVLLIFHWNACLVYALRGYLSFSNHFWDMDDKFYNYLNAYYMSCRTLILVETLPRPKDKSKVGLAFIIVESVVALVIFASVLGHVAGIVANISAARKQFQGQLDSVKTYMRIRKVPRHLQRKVVRWFDYWWSTKKYGNDGAVMECLPDKLKAEIAIHVHLDTLKRVEIFRNTEPGFLCELVLKLRPMLFSPGDYVCRKGEVGNEMYIVSIGRLHVLADDGRTVLATLKAGSYFGEISVLNMGTEGNRRTASVVSVGYSDLFCLSKHDIWEVLKDYPAARNRLELIAQKRLHQKLAHKAAMISKAAAAASRRDRLTSKLSDASQRRGSAPAVIHLSCATSGGGSRGPSPSQSKLSHLAPGSSAASSRRPSDQRPSKSNITTVGIGGGSSGPSYRRLGPAAAFSRSSHPLSKPPVGLTKAASDEASTLCGLEDMDEEAGGSLVKSERAQLLLTNENDGGGAGGSGQHQFANEALVLSPDANDPPPFIDEVSTALNTPRNSAAGISGGGKALRQGAESQTVL